MAASKANRLLRSRLSVLDRSIRGREDCLRLRRCRGCPRARRHSRGARNRNAAASRGPGSSRLCDRASIRGWLETSLCRLRFRVGHPACRDLLQGGRRLSSESTPELFLSLRRLAARVSVGLALELARMTGRRKRTVRDQLRQTGATPRRDILSLDSSLSLLLACKATTRRRPAGRRTIWRNGKRLASMTPGRLTRCYRIARTTPPSARTAAPFVAEASGLDR